jgi:hypothetical protein
MNKENKVLVKAGAEVILAPTVYKMLSFALNYGDDDIKTKLQQVVETVGKVVMTAVVAEVAGDFVTKRLDVILKSLVNKG